MASAYERFRPGYPEELVDEVLAYAGRPVRTALEMPDHRWRRVAAMLRRDGIFASFGGQMHLADPEVERAVSAARAQFLADDGVPPPDGTPAASPMQWPGTELLQSDRFTDVRQSKIERRVELSARDYLGHLSTISAYSSCPKPFESTCSTGSERCSPSE